MPTVTGIATSFIDFTRASNATVTDSDGRVKWAPHNLLLNSESFDAASWLKGSVAVTANSVSAPNGTTTADELAFGTTSGYFSQATTSMTSNTSYTYGVWLRAKTGTFKLKITRTNLASWATATVSPEITLTTDWQFCTLAFTTGAAETVSDFVIGYEGKTPYSLPATGSVYAWGASLYRSDLAMQPNTSAYPMYNPTTPKNLLGYTESFDNAAWSKGGFLSFGSGSTVNAILAPNGLSSADLLTLDTANGYHVIYVSGVSLAGSVGTHSIYVKPNGYTKVALRENNAAQYYASFSLSGAGSVLDNTATYATPAIAALDNGWYRISMRLTNAASQTYSFWVLPESYTTGSPVSLWTPNGTSGIYLWGAQLSDSASLDPYVPVYGAAVTSAAYYGPRRDFDGATLACKGLLVEEQRTNLVLYSAAFNDASWALTGATISDNVAGATAVAPDGTNTADKLVEDTSTGNHRTLPSSALVVVSGSPYTYSVYAKAAERTKIIITDNDLQGATFDLSAGTVSSLGSGVTAPPPVLVSNGWYRCAITRNAGTVNGRIGIFLADGTGAISYTGVTGNGALFWGAQVEAGSFATSYIPTGSANATRTADVASVSTQAFPYSATEGTLVANGSFISLTDTGVSVMASLNNNNSTNSVNIYRQSAAIQMNTFSSGANTVTYSVAASTTPIKAAIAYKLNDANAAVNGTAQTADTTSALPIGVDRLDIGRMWASYGANGWIRQITYIPRRLSDAELASRTTV
jgi:hypothetical protein